MDLERIFEQAWHEQAYTRSELPPVDVNQVLATSYEDVDFVFTKTMLWDMEVRKASAPDKYIPTVVRPGSAEKFPGTRAGRHEDFTRVSDQKLWLDPSRSETIIEHVRLDHEEQRVTFIGAGEFTAPDGRVIAAGTGQPLFHVEHAAGGTEERPLNLWRIVHLTSAPDPRLTELFEQAGKNPYLPVFIEVYIEQDLGRKLTRRS